MSKCFKFSFKISPFLHFNAPSDYIMYVTGSRTQEYTEFFKLFYSLSKAGETTKQYYNQVLGYYVIHVNLNGYIKILTLQYSKSKHSYYYKKY